MAEKLSRPEDILRAEPNSVSRHEIQSTSTVIEAAPTQPVEPADVPELEANETGNDRGSNLLTGFKLYLVVAALMLAGFLVALNGSFVATASPRVTTDFHSIEDIGWYGSAYLVANCAVQPLTGKIYSIFSLKSTFFSFLAVFQLGSLLCATANGSVMFIVGRAVAGMGGAGLINGCINSLTAVAPLEKRPTLMGMIFSVSTIGSVIGPLIGGALTEKLTWRWCFYLNLPLGVIAGLVLLQVPTMKTEHQTSKRNFLGILWQLNPRAPTTHIREVFISGKRGMLRIFLQLDLLGFFTFALAVVICLIAIEWGGTTYPWSSLIILGLFCGSAVAFAVFMIGQYYKGDAAMIPLGILSKKVVYCGFLTVIFQLGGLYVLTYYTPVWFQVVKGASPLLSGIYILPTVISQIISAGVTGKLVSKLGYYLPWAVFGSILTSIGSGLMSTYTPYTEPGQWIGFQILVGSGRGMTLQQPVTAIQTVLPANQIAQATALMMFANYFGGAVFVSLGKTVLLNRLIPALQNFSPTLNAQDLLNAGATGVRNVISEAELPGVLMAFNESLTETFYLAAGAGAVAFITSWGLGLRSVKKNGVKYDE